MMAELEVDQSHLPRVEEVRQNFAVLEDGVLAHSLQEQEIEQYYTTNIQKNQLVQNDIRVAKRLQDEEEEQRAQYSALLRQTSRQMEERDFEYARVIQEEIQRRAEEARRREMDDEELAKQIQEEEEERMRRTREASSSGSEEQYSPFSSRGQRSTSDYSSSQCNSPQAGSPRGQRTNARLRSSGGHSFRNPREGLLNEESDESDSVFSELCVRSRTVPSQCKARDRDYRSVISHTSVSEHNNDYARDHLDGDYNENGYVERRRARNCFIERDYRRESGSWQRNQDVQAELAEVRERRCKRTESVRLPDRRRESFRDGAKTWAYKDNPDKHVRFRDESRKSEKDENGSREVWEMLGQVLRERGVPVRMGNSGAPLQIGAAQRRERRGSHSLYGSEASYSDIQTHHSHFQRASAARHSFHGDIRERRHRSFNREQTQGQCCEPVQPETESRQRESSLSKDRQGSRRWKERKYVTRDESNAIEHGITRTNSERRPERVHRSTEQERPERRTPNRSQSLRSRHTPLAERDRTSLELGELQQVLHDEELARKLQEEEERVEERSPGPLARSSCPDGDFTVAQVAQDEEIARYMQKQEIKWKRRSRELEGPVSWREHKAMMSQHDRRARERQVPRERLDSEGLPSPTEEQPHSPVSTLQTASQIRNIAEELDPTFPGRSPGTESLRGDQTGSCCAPLPAPQSGFQDEPTFIPPTKRQAEKSVRPKSKEKRENCKQQ